MSVRRHIFMGWLLLGFVMQSVGSIALAGENLPAKVSDFQMPPMETLPTKPEAQQLVQPGVAESGILHSEPESGVQQSEPDSRVLQSEPDFRVLGTGIGSGNGASGAESSVRQQGAVLLSSPEADEPLTQDPQNGAEHLSWLLPMSGPMSTGADVAITEKKKTPRRFDTGINLSDGRNLVAARVDELLDAALANNAQTVVLDKAVGHFRTRTQAAIAEAKDTVDYLIPYRGFGSSSEAGDIILGEKLKLKSRASAEYAKQKLVDEIHGNVVENVLQIAMGVGLNDKNKQADCTTIGVAGLKELVGDQQANETAEVIRNLAKDIQVPESVYAQGAWDVQTRKQKFNAVLTAAIDSDPILHEVTKRLHKYNKRSTFARVSTHVVQTTLGVASMSPDLIGAAARSALVTFVMANGGPEQAKLLKELYLDKRFESRVRVLNDETHRALENYQIGILTRNPVLLACSESLVNEMGGESAVTNALGVSILPKQVMAADPRWQEL